jgi:hypothetical protein
MNRMTTAADIVVYDEYGRIVLLAEVKALPKTDPSWAAKTRSEVLRFTRGFVPPYFLVIARDFSYLWTSPAATNAAPDTSINTQELFREYLDAVDSNASDLADPALELLGGIWLRDLTSSRTRGPVLPQLFDLAAAVENGRIEFATAA